MNKLRVAVVGAGRLGGFHAQKLSRFESVELVGIADPVASQRERVASECKTAPLADHRELLGKIDAAVIATPTRFHHAVARDFLDRGVHLLVEKPLCSSSREADDLAQTARRRGLVLQVGHVERFNPAFTVALTQLPPAAPKYVEAVRASGFTFRSTDVGVVLDLMIHDIDLVLSLVRSPLRRVEAFGISVLGGHEDVANARLEFESGCVAALSASRVSYEASRRMHIWSNRAFASVDFASRKTTFVRPSETLLKRQFDVDAMTPDQLARKEQILQELLPREEAQAEPVDALTAELADFVESIAFQRSPRVTGEDGRDAVAVAEQILAKIASHAWDGRLDGPRGPLAQPQSSVLPSPHFPAARSPRPRLKEAG